MILIIIKTILCIIFSAISIYNILIQDYQQATFHLILVLISNPEIDLLNRKIDNNKE